jgi:NAD(P)-dependent dehydrogenase (short-subunit alcohol dehydrogenase family)
MPGPQHGKVAIITGGTANMGRMFAQSLASDGANVVVHYNSPGAPTKPPTPSRSSRRWAWRRQLTRVTSPTAHS